MQRPRAPVGSVVILFKSVMVGTVDACACLIFAVLVLRRVRIEDQSSDVFVPGSGILRADRLEKIRVLACLISVLCMGVQSTACSC